MSTFLLIRHGLTAEVGQRLSGRSPGVLLSESGSRQAMDLAGRAQKFPISAVYSSPLERAVDTARPIAFARGLLVKKVEALNEIDFGSWTGKPFQDLESDAEWRRYNLLRTFVAAPGGESLLDAQNRALRLLERLSGEHADSTVALVTHSDIIKAIVLACLGASPQMVHQLEIEPASISVIEFGVYAPRVIAINRID